jgi:glycosyltransferase involved in cell wall biosynthesis
MAHTKPCILFLASWYPVPNNPSHGIFIQNHAKALSKFCSVFVVYAFSEKNAKGFRLSKQIVNEQLQEWRLVYKKNTRTLPIVAELLKYIRFKRAYRLILKELLAQKINVTAIQINALYPVAIVLPLFQKIWRVPVVLIEHWTGYLTEDGNYKGLLMKYFTRKTIQSVDKIFYVSEQQKLAMISHGLQGNYELIFNVIDADIFYPNNDTKPAKPIILHVSSLDDPQKNISGLLRVVQRLEQKNENFEMVFVGGDMELVNKFIHKGTTMGLKNVVFVGSKNQHEIAKYMHRACALVLFSNYENMPVVVLEALACGLPVISTDTGYVRNMVLNDFGVLIEVGNENMLTSVLINLLDGTLSFNQNKMIEFVKSHAGAEVVGKKLFTYYSSLS